MGRRNLSPEEQTARLVDGLADLLQRGADSPHGRKHPELQNDAAEARQRAADIRRELGVD